MNSPSLTLASGSFCWADTTTGPANQLLPGAVATDARGSDRLRETVETYESQTLQVRRVVRELSQFSDVPDHVNAKYARRA